MVGFVVSSIVKVAVVVDVFPQSSVAVNVTVSVPVAPHRSDNPVLLLVHTTPPQTSDVPVTTAGTDPKISQVPVSLFV